MATFRAGYNIQQKAEQRHEPSKTLGEQTGKTGKGYKRKTGDVQGTDKKPRT
jgi:hypothetical protein